MSQVSRRPGRRAADDACRRLWSAVVVQALEDLDSLPMDTLEYRQTVACFTVGGPWLASRTTIADHLDIHPDDLRRAGERGIARRRPARGPGAGRGQCPARRLP